MTIDWTEPDFAFLLKQLQTGRACLFLGAGFSVDAKNELGTSPPLGGDLARLLAAEAGFTLSGESLPVVFEATKKRIGSARLADLLRKNYDIVAMDDWYNTVSQFTWHRIYTINIDNLLQAVYSKQGGMSGQRLRIIVNPAPVEERDVLFQELQCVHLHGHVDTAANGLTFTLADFASLTTAPNPWYQILMDDMAFRSIVFVGTQLEEPMFHHYLQLRAPKEIGTPEQRPKSFLVNRTIGQIRADNLRERNIRAVECTAKEFFTSLATVLQPAQAAVASVRSVVFPTAVFPSGNATDADLRIHRHFFRVDPSARLLLRTSRPQDFFMGAEPDWSDIAEERDATRTISRELVAAVAEHRNEQHTLVLHGPAGSGKTTALMRTAQLLSVNTPHVYYAKGLEKLDLSGILELAQQLSPKGERVILCLDVFGRHMTELMDRCDAMCETSNLTLVLSERSNKYATISQAVSRLSPLVMRMPDLDEADVSAIIGKLEKFGFLGKLRDKAPAQRVAAFMERASKQLLVALRESTSGEGFDRILRNEYGELEQSAKLAYTIACIAVAQGAPGVYLRHLTPCLGRAVFAKGVVVRDLLRGVLVPHNQSETIVKPRHRLIASWVANEIAPTGVKVEAITKFLRQVSPDIIPGEIRRRSPQYLAYRGMINSEALREMFANDHEVIIGIYEELKPCYDKDFLFWLQFGMAQTNAGRLDVAENYVNQSIAMNKNSHQSWHQLGCLSLLQATRAFDPAAATEKADKGIELLQLQIAQHGDVNSYPYHAYLIHVTRWYQKLGRLVAADQWEALRAVGKDATRKYPGDKMVKDAVQELERQYLLRTVDQGSGK